MATQKHTANGSTRTARARQQLRELAEQTRVTQLRRVSDTAISGVAEAAPLFRHVEHCRGFAEGLAAAGVITPRDAEAWYLYATAQSDTPPGDAS